MTETLRLWAPIALIGAAQPHRTAPGAGRWICHIAILPIAALSLGGGLRWPDLIPTEAVRLLPGVPAF